MALVQGKRIPCIRKPPPTGQKDFKSGKKESGTQTWPSSAAEVADKGDFFQAPGHGGKRLPGEEKQNTILHPRMRHEQRQFCRLGNTAKGGPRQRKHKMRSVGVQYDRKSLIPGFAKDPGEDRCRKAGKEPTLCAGNSEGKRGCSGGWYKRLPGKYRTDALGGWPPSKDVGFFVLLFTK